MAQQSYRDAAEKLFSNLEESLSMADLDWDIQEGILTIEFEDETQLVISRQTALQEIWIASPLGAKHFQWRNECWETQQGEGLMQSLKTIFEHHNIQVTL